MNIIHTKYQLLFKEEPIGPLRTIEEIAELSKSFSHLTWRMVKVDSTEGVSP